jgi:O-antigen ligase
MGGIVALLILNLPMPAALASSIVGAFVLLAFVDTRVAVLAVILVRPAADLTTTIPLLSASGASNVNANALMSLVVIALGVSHIAINRLQLRRVPLAVPFAAFVGCVLLGVAVAPDANQAAQDFLRILGTLMVFVLCVDALRTQADQRWLVRVILLSSIVPLMVGAYQYVANTGNYDKGFNRIYGTFVNPPPYADFLVQLLPLAVVFLMHTRSRIARVGLAAMVPVMLFSIYATQTRGAWVGVIIIIMVWLWTRARRTLLLVPLVLGAIYFGVPSVRARVSEATSGTCVSRTNCDSSALWRLKQWQAAIQIPSPPMLLTVGAGFSAVNVTLGNRTHNEYVRLLVESGLLGFIAIAVLYRRLFFLTLKTYRESATPYQRDLALAFMAVFISRLVMAATDNILDIVVIEWYFWAFAAVIVVESGAYDRFARLRERDRRPERSTRRVDDAVAASPPAVSAVSDL